MSKRAAAWSGRPGPRTFTKFRAMVGTAGHCARLLPMMQAQRPRWLPHGAALAAAVLSAAVAPAAVAASAVGHVSVTILPASAGVGGGAMTFGAVGSASGPVSGGVTATGAPGTPITLSLSAGDLARGPGMPIPFRVAAASPRALPTIDRSGTLRLMLGATLSLGRQQAPGAYRGDYTVTVDY